MRRRSTAISTTTASTMMIKQHAQILHSEKKDNAALLLNKESGVFFYLVVCLFSSIVSISVFSRMQKIKRIRVAWLGLCVGLTMRVNCYAFLCLNVCLLTRLPTLCLLDLSCLKFYIYQLYLEISMTRTIQ